MAEAEDKGFFTPPSTPDPLRENKKKSKGKWLVWVLVIFLLLGSIGAGGYFAFQRLVANNDEEVGAKTDSGSQSLPLSGSTGGEIVTGAEAGDVEQPFGDARFTSENFRVGDIAIAGEAEFLLTEDTIAPLTVSNIRGDTFSEKNSQDVSLIVSWRTNKLARSEITYSKGAGQPERTVREAQYGFTHSLIIPDLDSGSTYIYVIRTSDRFGNAVASEAHAVYTGSREASLFDLIAEAVGDIFGWALKE